jgi:hypothetical protein
MIGYSYRTKVAYLDATQWTGEVGEFPGGRRVPREIRREQSVVSFYKGFREVL